MEELRAIIINLVAVVFGFLQPISDFMTAVVILFAANFLCGLVADAVSGEGWRTKKALQFILHCFIFFGLAFFLFSCGHFLHNEAGAVQCVSYICYVAFYIYFVNILRNLCGIVDEKSRLFQLLNFLYWVVTLKFAERIPYLKEYRETYQPDADGGVTDEQIKNARKRAGMEGEDNA